MDANPASGAAGRGCAGHVARWWRYLCHEGYFGTLLLVKQVTAPASTSRVPCRQSAEGAPVLDIAGALLIAGYMLVLIRPILHTFFHWRGQAGSLPGPPDGPPLACGQMAVGARIRLLYFYL